MAVPVGGLQPLIGYAMQQLGREGETPDTVAERMQRMSQERGWNPALIPTALVWAIGNQRATFNFQSRAASAKIKNVLPRGLEPGERVGVRVLMTIISDRGGVGRHMETVSVVMNVSQDMTKGQIVSAATALWHARSSGLPSGDNFVGFAGEPEIVAVFQGGYESGIEV